MAEFKVTGDRKYAECCVREYVVPLVSSVWLPMYEEFVYRGCD